MPLFGKKPDVAALERDRDLERLAKAMHRGPDEEPALQALIRLDDPASVPPAVRGGKGGPDTAIATQRLVGHFGPRAAAPLTEMLLAKDAEVRAALWLAWLGPEVALEPLAAAVDEAPAAKSRMAAAHALGRLPASAQSVAALSGAVADAELIVAAAASESIERLHDPRFVAPLIAAADAAASKDHRHFATKPLMKLADRPYLTWCLDSDDPEVSSAAADALALIDENELADRG